VAYAVGFTDGTGAHIRDLARRGLHAYSGYGPVAAQVFFVSLVFLDPLVVVLVLRMRPAGVWLAGAVIAVDLAANWFDNWPSLTAVPPRLVGMLPLTLFGLLVLASMVPLRRSLAAPGSPPLE
jgi:hypothetical protein